ncbi:MAG: alpha/beta hydrolase [bacterium]|nr:alpha/beta hydrolase [bacterium]
MNKINTKKTIVSALLPKHRSLKKTGGILLAYKSEAGHEKMISLYEGYLQKISIPYKEMDVDTSWGTTHVIKSGLRNKKPLVVLHGGGINAPLMFLFTPELSQDYAVYYIDIMGQPGKSVPRKVPVKSTELTNWLNEVFMGLNIDRADILGSSFGSYIGQWFLHNHPEKVNKLVMTLYTFYNKQKYISPLFIARLLYLSRKKTPAATRKLLELVNVGKIEDMEVNDLVVEYFTNVYKHCVTGRELMDSLPAEAIKAIQSPVQIIIGEKDPFFNVKKGEDLCKKINNPFISFHKVPLLGHFGNDKTEEIFGKALDFLKG